MDSVVTFKGLDTPDSPKRCSDDKELHRLLSELTNSTDYKASKKHHSKETNRCVQKTPRNEFKENNSNLLQSHLQMKEVPVPTCNEVAHFDGECLKPSVSKFVLSSDEASEDSENSQPVPLSAFLTGSPHLKKKANFIPSSPTPQSDSQMKNLSTFMGTTSKRKVLLSSRKLKALTSDIGTSPEPVESIKFETTQAIQEPRITNEPSLRNSEEGCGKFHVVSNTVFAVNSKYFHAVGVLGEGGCGKVYQVLERQSGMVLALKKVNLKKGDATLVMNELNILKKLQNSDRVVKMFDYELKEDSLLIVLEKGDCDLAKIIKDVKRGQLLSPIQVKYYWSEMLLAVADIHKAGIIHLDLKPANFVQVMGKLKLIDFGISGAIPDDKTCIVKDNQVGTINYMSPEQLTGSHEQGQFQLRTKSDVWSLGCILYHLLFGCTPFHHITQTMPKLAAISNPNHIITYPKIADNSLLNVLQSCLKYNPKTRPSIDELLTHPYLTGS